MKNGKKALFVGTTCILTYVVNYYLRHILSVLTPTLISTGDYTVSHVAALSSTYMLLYAAGQLVNGFLGDAFSPKYMVSVGLFVSGGAVVLFPFVTGEFVQILCFAALGFGLSMLRGPLMKIISENTQANYARLICVFFSFASFAGPLVASAFALIRGWNTAFVCAGAVAMVLGAVSCAVFTLMEKRGLISYLKTETRGWNSVLEVFRIKNIFFYFIVACLVEVSSASINQWLTMFLTTQLGFSKEFANVLYSVILICSSLMPFVALAVFRAIGERDLPMMRVAFSVSAVFFALLPFVGGTPWLSYVVLIVALMAMSCSSALLWSIYIPSLAQTGRVSSANGVLDCVGYVVAAGANLLFAGVMSTCGWNTVYLLWASLGVIGLFAAFVFRGKKEV